MSDANEALVRRHFEEIWNRKDLAAADELMAQDYLEHAVAPFGQAEPGRVNGPAAMRQTAQWLLEPALVPRTDAPVGFVRLGQVVGHRDAVGDPGQVVHVAVGVGGERAAHRDDGLVVLRCGDVVQVERSPGLNHLAAEDDLPTALYRAEEVGVQ